MSEEFELWGGDATDPVWGVNLGRTVLKTHPATACQGQRCVIHNPSDHHMRHWPTTWRGDRNMMERTCPHGVGHPDPDDLAYQVRIGHSERAAGAHGCDGCCHDPSNT